ncbi:hypothetical protein NX722_13730 [Endozoicomonas gorgoniicola]|uniref:Uncharacterized protein n=1 Tax=Endozoicomonas gorgoniicola TaxID=1234144 RepID=A0ABT3MWB3_9GAMM|nr:hypothetical protein [Endozoicomonas gorgoniicola]MCW7553669.1 hypothetical protein [Endozoicomonas gorgoniicola]
MSIKDQLSDDDGFNDFLQQIVESEGLEEAAEGITRKVIAEGRESLSKKQEYVFQTRVVDEFGTGDCKRCGEDIPWSEMYAANENGCLCGWCAHMVAKDE